MATELNHERTSLEDHEKTLWKEDCAFPNISPDYKFWRLAANITDFDDRNIGQENVVVGELGVVVKLHFKKWLTVWVEDDSPYPEVRSAVANTDDPSIPASTLRAWILGMCTPTKDTCANVHG